MRSAEARNIATVPASSARSKDGLTSGSQSSKKFTKFRRLFIRKGRRHILTGRSPFGLNLQCETNSALKRTYLTRHPRARRSLKTPKYPYKIKNKYNHPDEVCYIWAKERLRQGCITAGSNASGTHVFKLRIYWRCLSVKLNDNLHTSHYI